MNEMIRVMVIIYGLVVFVPQDDKLTVLFIGDEGHGDIVHVPVVTVVGTGEEALVPQRLDPAFNFEIQASDPVGKPNLTGLQDFVRLEELFTHPSRGVVRKECLDDDGCETGGEDVIRGKLEITGTWTTRPATYCKDRWSSPIEFDSTLRYEFWSWMRRFNRGEPTRRIPSALRLDTELPENWVDERLDGLATQAVLEGEECKKWIGEDVPRCIVLLIGNAPTLAHSSPSSSRISQQSEPLDRHFSAFYRVAEDPPWRINRRLPYIRSSLTCPREYPDPVEHATVIVTKPAPECPPLVGTAEP